MEFNISFKPINKGKFLGSANVTFDNQFKINGVSVFAGKEEGAVSVVMPSYKKIDPVSGNTEYQPLVVLSKDLGNRFREAIKGMINDDLNHYSSNPEWLKANDLPHLFTSVKCITPFTGGEKNPNLRGFANLSVFDGKDNDIIHLNSICIREVKNSEGQNFLTVSMPREKVPVKGGQFTWHDQCHPITKELRDDISKLVRDEYRKAVNEHGTPDKANEAQNTSVNDEVSANENTNSLNEEFIETDLSKELDNNEMDVTIGIDEADSIME